MASNTASFTVEDYTPEKSTTSVNIGPLTAANFTAKRAAIDTYKAAVAGLILGEIRQTNITESFAESADPVASVNAQRERKWRVKFRDVTQFFDVGNTINNVGFGQTFDVEIPTANLALLTTNSEFLDLTETAPAAFVTAAEAIVNSPWGGNECEVVSIEHVGRRL